MKGIIFNLLEQVVTDAHGADAWDDLLDTAGLDGTYSRVGQYDDEELTRLVEAAADRLDRPVPDVIRWFGEDAIPLLRAAYPTFFADHRDLRSFLLGLNGIIHAEVRKLHPGAVVPHFDYLEREGTPVLSYRSARRLCALAEGFILGAAKAYGQHVVVTQPVCMLHGAARCELHVTAVDGGG